jgi:hypothetical protein
VTWFYMFSFLRRCVHFQLFFSLSSKQCQIKKKQVQFQRLIYYHDHDQYMFIYISICVCASVYEHYNKD